MFSGLVVEDGEQDEDGEQPLALADRGLVAPHEAQPPALDHSRGAEVCGQRDRGRGRWKHPVDLDPFG